MVGVIYLNVDIVFGFYVVCVFVVVVFCLFVWLLVFLTA